jgi:glycosyltransferase involved in cell wall biosynthesis
VTSQRPRILIAVGSLEVGGTERQIVDVCRALREEFEFHVITVAAQRGPFEEPLRETGAQHHALRSAPGSSSSSRLIRAWRAGLSAVRFRRTVRRVQPDLIHAYLFEMSIAAVAAQWPRRAPPLLLSRRSLVQWIAHDPIYFPVARWMNRRADLILANSEAVRRDAVEKERLDPEHVRVIYNGVDTGSFPPGPPDDALYAELGVSRTLPVVGMIANLHSYKGHEEMIEAAALLKKSGVEFTLLFVGREGNASERVADLVRETGSSRLVVAGPRSDVPRLLRFMDVVVSASHEEGFSNSILEAMSAARPIVATAVGGTVEQITDGVTGLLVEPRSPEALSKAIGRLLENGELRKRLGSAARQTVLERFSLDRLLANMSALYHEWTRDA